jgi:hypothetical protein
MKIIVLILTALLFVGVCLATTDLRTNTDWIHKVVEEHGFFQFNNPDGSLFYAERAHIIFDGCETTVKVTVTHEKETVDMDVLFNLKDLDPNVVVSPRNLEGNALPNGREWVLLKTADGYRSIAIRRGTSIASPIAVFPLMGGNTREQTRALATVFHNAITACIHTCWLPEGCGGEK